MSLPRLSLVDERYAVVRVLRTLGLFSHTYLAREVHTDEEVLMIEYFPEGLVRRSDGKPDVQVPDGLRRRLFDYGLDCFVDEHEGLCGLGHPNVVTEQAAFEAHGTVYRVQAHEEGASLESVLKRRDVLAPEAALAVLLPLLGGLEAMHEAGLVHGGIAPSAVMLTQRGQPLLQHVRQAQLRLAREMEMLPDVLLPGYAPPEQYLPGFKAGPWVDLYAASALLFRMLGGRDLPDARHRLRHDDVPTLVRSLDVEKELVDAMLHALELDPTSRPDTAGEWLDQLQACRHRLVSARSSSAEVAAGDADPVVADGRVANAGTGERAPDRPAVTRTTLIATLALVLAFLGVVAFGSTVLVRGSDTPGRPQVEHAAIFAKHGDTLFEAGHFEAARTFYERALDISPSDIYVLSRLVEAKRRLYEEQGGSYVVFMRQGDSLRTLAEALVQAGRPGTASQLYEEASGRYVRALKSRPGDSLTLARLRQVADHLFPDETTHEISPATR